MSPVISPITDVSTIVTIELLIYSYYDGQLLNCSCAVRYRCAVTGFLTCSNWCAVTALITDALGVFFVFFKDTSCWTLLISNSSFVFFVFFRDTSGQGLLISNSSCVFFVFFRDTSGQGRFSTIIRSYSRGAQGVILVFDITNKWSFDGIERWRQEVEEVLPLLPVLFLLTQNRT
jgi:hypothetical protein